jgi:hypothetical protein
MNVFKKYEFYSQEQYNELKEQLQDDTSVFVELGELRDNKHSVDVLWSTGNYEQWQQYEINNVEGNGSHTFLGYEFNNTQL